MPVIHFDTGDRNLFQLSNNEQAYTMSMSGVTTITPWLPGTYRVPEGAVYFLIQGTAQHEPYAWTITTHPARLSTELRLCEALTSRVVHRTLTRHLAREHAQEKTHSFSS